MTVRAGTSGFSYKEWKGSFYPEDLPQRGWLSHYAGQLPAVEINNTFYRMPKREVLEGWAAQVPEAFRFAIKASRRITHIRRLKDASEEVGYLLGNLAFLGDRLGAVLFQLPPNLRADRPRLEAFLDLLDESTPAVFEFRHESWRDSAITALLRDRGVALCVAETDDEPARELTAPAPLGYMRLRRSDYDPAALAAWNGRVEEAGFEDAYVFFKHEDQSPALALDFQALADRQRTLPVRRQRVGAREAG